LPQGFGALTHIVGRLQLKDADVELIYRGIAKRMLQAAAA